MRLRSVAAPFTAAFLICGLLAGCESLGLVTSESNASRNIAKERNQSPIRATEDKSVLGDGGFSILGGGSEEEAGAQLPVNKYLWRGTLDTLSFLPLTSTDPYGGVIVTDWGAAPDSPEERFKVTAYITSATLKPQSLNVVVNRQTRGEAGAWVSAPVSAETSRSLEDAILTRARQLRSADNNAG